MDLTAFTLVVTAALLHALWNLAAKRVSGNIGVLWLGLCVGALVLAPFAAYSALGSFELAGLPYMAATGLLHAAYFSLLAASYRHGELSIVYPLARGTGVAGTALFARVVLGERLLALGALGVSSVCLGIVLLGLRQRRRPGHSRSYYLAVLVGLTITAYPVVDKLGVERINPVVYFAGLAASAALLLAPLVMVAYRQEWRQAWQEYRWTSLWVGLGGMATYLLVLAALQRAPASYVVAARELAIAVAAALGVTVLKEPLTMTKALSTGAIVAGVILVKVA
jgi:drug/metabolite transporter (DMT)-like permease